MRIVDIDAPRRVYPGDKFAVSAVLQGSGEKPLEVEVQLLDGLDKGPSKQNPSETEQGVTPPGEVIDSQRVRVKNDGTLTGIRFELEPEAVGRRRLAIRIVAPEADNNEEDNIRDARYEVVGEKLKVLAVAGGPTREYRFVRNMLYRDNSIQLDAWLQTGQPGISQDADNILSTFPSTAEELFKYDAIALFDPNWLDLSAEQLTLLDRWLSRQAGGMIIVAGPVYHPEWKRRRTDPRMATIAG
ncbi:MAG: VWA domain-containing protein, partial [Proteobacteria bacterium]|nr:VWA domain-containing protein [Pseudomonadota bacterium]